MSENGSGQPELHAEFPGKTKYQDLIGGSALVRRQGKITEVIGQVIEAYNPGTSVGSLCTIHNPDSGRSVMGEVVGFKGEKMLLMPLGQMPDIGPRCRIIPEERAATVKVGDELKGRILDGLGKAIDHQGEIVCPYEMPLYADAINPLHRRRITEPIDVGVRTINGLLTCGKGQRVGVPARAWANRF